MCSATRGFVSDSWATCNNRSTPVEKFVLLSTKLSWQNKHFSAQNALKLIYRHLGFQKKNSGDDTPDPLWKGKGREGKEGEGRGRAPIRLLAQAPPSCKSGPDQSLRNFIECRTFKLIGGLGLKVSHLFCDPSNSCRMPAERHAPQTSYHNNVPWVSRRVLMFFRKHNNKSLVKISL